MRRIPIQIESMHVSVPEVQKSDVNKQVNNKTQNTSLQTANGGVQDKATEHKFTHSEVE